MKIGDLQLANPVLLAPMAGITDLPYRLIMKRFGAALVFTEMISATGLCYGGSGSRELLRTDPAEQPLGVQLFGDDPLRLAEAARQVEAQAAVIDLNCGCPVRKVVSGGAGSALLRDPARVARIIAAVRRATTRPLTIKLRSGWDAQSRNFLEIARLAVAEGVDAVTLHPRTRAQMFGGRADWSELATLKGALPVPVIASGDLFSADDAHTVLAGIGCDGLMVARGGYGNPWLIQQILARLQGEPAALPTASERLAVAREHLDLFVATYGPTRAAAHMRKHLSWYVRGIGHAASFRQQLNQVRSVTALHDLLNSFEDTAA
jgi:nifR3 family TIM-barrel protein